MVGSRDSVAEPNVVLNTIVAEAFSEACDVLEQTEDFDMTVHDLIKKYASEHQRIVFNGNGYSEEWVEEAKRRGLPNIKTMVDAIPVLTEEKTVKLFEDFGVFTRAELESRAEIQYETYSKAINIEARSMIDIASKHIIPAVLQYTTALASSVNQIREACAEANISVQIELLKECSSLLAATKAALKELTRGDGYRWNEGGRPGARRLYQGCGGARHGGPAPSGGPAGDAGSQGHVAHALLRRSAF